MSNIRVQKGFGVLEVLIASTVIITILGALVTVGTMAINTNEKLLQKAEATYLAQEGIEMVRQIRDTNWVDEAAKNTSWDQLVLDQGNKIRPLVNTNYYLSKECTEQTKGCILKTSNEDTSAIGYNNVTYTRTIRFEAADGLMPDKDPDSDLSDSRENNSLKVIVTVTWPNNASVSVSELLTNWRPNF